MFLEKSYRGNNKWYFYILTLIIVFAAVQVASIPLAIYSIIMNPEILSVERITFWLSRTRTWAWHSCYSRSPEASSHFCYA